MHGEPHGSRPWHSHRRHVWRETSRQCSDLMCWAVQEAEDGSVEGIDVRLGADDVISIASGGSAELALWDGVLSIADVSADSADIIVSDGVSQVHALSLTVVACSGQGPRHQLLCCCMRLPHVTGARCEAWPRPHAEPALCAVVCSMQVACPQRGQALTRCACARR